MGMIVKLWEELNQASSELLPIQVYFKTLDQLEKERVKFLWNLLCALHKTTLNKIEPVHLSAVDWEPGPIQELRRGKWCAAPNVVKGFRNKEDYIASLAVYAWIPTSIRITDFLFRELGSPLSLFTRVNNGDSFSCTPMQIAGSNILGLTLTIPERIYMTITNRARKEFGSLVQCFKNQGLKRLLQHDNLPGEWTAFLFEELLRSALQVPSPDYSGGIWQNLCNDLEECATSVMEAIKNLNLGQLPKNFKEICREVCKVALKTLLYGAWSNQQVDYFDYWAIPTLRYDETVISFLGILIHVPQSRSNFSCHCKCGAKHLYDCEQMLEGLLWASTLWAAWRWGQKVHQEVLRGGTKVGVTSLGARNLSHHLGSHILHWLEQEARELADEFERMAHSASGESMRLLFFLAHHFKSKALFYAYLRERMDLVAGMAVYLPTWTATTSLNTLLAGIKFPGQGEESLVLRHIGQSEGVYCVDVTYCHGDGRKEIAVPGSAMGNQAFYGLLENIARDAAKYGDIKCDEVVIVTPLKNDRKWNLHESPSTLLKCFHLDVDPISQDWTQELKSIKNKSSTDSRCLVVKVSVEEGKACEASRQLWEEKKLTGNFTVWSVNVSQGCRHQLCKIVRELLEALQQNNSDQVCKRAAELDCALLSVTVEISDLDDSDFETENEGWKALDEQQKQQKKQQARENLYRVVIYDDRSSYSKNEARIKEAIKGLERDGLCDEFGRLRTDDWGIKERYIFAAYLRGEKLEDWLMPESIRAEKSAIPPVLRVKDCNGKLGWVFYMLKPKDILIVSDTHRQDDVPQDKRERINVRPWDALKRMLGSSALRHKFVILCPKDENQLTEVKGILDYIPYRVFICTQLEVPPEIKEQCATLTNLGLSELDVDPLYEEWISFIVNRYKSCVPEVVESQGKPPKFYPNHNYWETNLGQLAREVALFDRHGNYANHVKAGNMSFLHYEPYVGGWPAERLVKEWRDMKDKGRNLVEYKIKEGALVPVLVVDERIDGSLDRKVCINCVEFSHRELWKLKGVDVMGQEYKSQGHEVPDEKPILECVRKASEQGRPYGFVLLHQGILDKLYKNLHNNQKPTKQQYVERIIEQIQMEGRVWHVVIHSGRGGVPYLPKGVKFLHLSSVEAWFGSNLTKADVIDELMSIRREDNELFSRNL